MGHASEMTFVAIVLTVNAEDYRGDLFLFHGSYFNTSTCQIRYSNGENRAPVVVCSTDTVRKVQIKFDLD